MSRTLNGSAALQCFECGNTFEIHNEIMFNFYPDCRMCVVYLQTSLVKSVLSLAELWGDVQDCHQRLSSAFDLLLFFLSSLIPTLTSPPNNAWTAERHICHCWTIIRDPFRSAVPHARYCKQSALRNRRGLVCETRFILSLVPRPRGLGMRLIYCHQRLSSAFHLPLIFLSSLIPTLTPPP